MRELVLKISMSADGFVGYLNGDLDWIFKSLTPDVTDWLVETLEGASLHVMGSRTFAGMADWWPRSEEPFAAPMNTLPKGVFSSDPAVVEHAIAAALANGWEDTARGAIADMAELPAALRSWAQAEILNGDVEAEVARLKRQPGSYMLAHGGASFVRSLVTADLIDEYRLLVHPIILGQGLPIFAGLRNPRRMNLCEAKVFAGGVVALIFRPDR